MVNYFPGVLMSDLVGIPAIFVRGGTSSGPYWNAKDLPCDPEMRDKILLAAMGTTDGTGAEIDESQLSGIGGGTPVTSKTAILSKSDKPGVDVDYLFAQVSFEREYVDTAPSCGNMLSAVGYAALEMGLVEPWEDETRIIIRNLNTGSLIETVVATPGKSCSYLGETKIDGVVGRSAPVLMNFMDVIGSKTGTMFPAGGRQQQINGLNVTLIDVAVPMVLFKANELGLNGVESEDELDDPQLIERMENVRLIAAEKMGLGDVRGSVVPKMAIISKPRQNGTVTSRYFVPQNCHPTHAVTGAICVATAVAEPGTIVNEIVQAQPQASQKVIIEHPAGTIDINLSYQSNRLTKAGVIRTVRKIMQGLVFVPKQLTS